MTLEADVIADPTAYRTCVVDYDVTHWENEPYVVDCGYDYGYEYAGGEYYVERADVWIGSDDIISVDRETLTKLVGDEAVEQLEADKTEDMK